MKTISPAELHALRSTGRGLTILDVRTQPEYAETRVPATRNIPLNSLDAQRLDGLSPEEPVYLLCRSGVRANLAAQKLTAAGFQQPVVVQGGTVEWTRSGLPVERDSRPLLARFLTFARLR